MINRMKNILGRIKLIIIINKIINKIRQYINKYILFLAWFIFNRFPFYRYLRKFDIVNIKPYKIKNWHIGHKYFIAEVKTNKKKVFIKTGGKFNLSSREVRAINKLKKEIIDSEKFLPELLAFNFTKPYDFIAMDFIEGSTLDELIKSNLLNKEDKNTILNQMYLLLKYLNRVNIIHRDIRPSNFIVNFDSDNKPKLIIIDFAYAVLSEKDEVFEIKKTKENIKLLNRLGSGLNPAYLTWDDAYSFLMTSNKVDINFKKNYPEIWIGMNNMIGDLYYEIK